jgi:hypothetical protein
LLAEIEDKKIEIQSLKAKLNETEKELDLTKDKYHE